MKTKLAPAQLSHIFDFGQRLLPEEILVESGVGIEVLYGTEDPVSLIGEITGYDLISVTYNFSGGLPGVTYRVYCAVVTSLGNKYISPELISVTGS